MLCNLSSFHNIPQHRSFFAWGFLKQWEQMPTHSKMLRSGSFFKRETFCLVKRKIEMKCGSEPMRWVAGHVSDWTAEGNLGVSKSFTDSDPKCKLSNGYHCFSSAVDCWDGPDGEPIVHHGYTLTSKILFKDVIETINKYAFIKNEYVYNVLTSET